MLWFKNKNAAAKTAHPAAAAEVRFVMPGFGCEGFNVFPADVLLDTRENSALLRQISLAVGGAESLFTDLLLPSIKHCAYTVQHLAASAPDSPTAHHAYAGGLLRHLLETMLFCVNEGRSIYINTDVLPSERELNRQTFILCCGLIGLTHDIGKIFDQEIVTYTIDGKELRWDPFEPLPEFLSRVHAVPMEHIFDSNGPRYDVKKWIPNRGGDHALYSNFLLRSCVLKKFLSHIQTVNPSLTRDFMAACVWSLLDKGFYKSEDNRLSRCLFYADAASCEWDAKRHKKALTVNLKTPEVYAAVCKTLRQFIRDGSLLINKTRGDCLLFSSGNTEGEAAAASSEADFKLFLRFDRVLEFLLLDKIRQHLLSDLRLDIFQDKDRDLAALRDFLTAVGLIEPCRYVITPGALLLLSTSDPFLTAHPELRSADPKNCEAVAFCRRTDLINDDDIPGNNPEYLKGLLRHRCAIVSAIPTKDATDEEDPEDTYRFSSEGVSDPQETPRKPEEEEKTAEATPTGADPEFHLTPQVAATAGEPTEIPVANQARTGPENHTVSAKKAPEEPAAVNSPAEEELINSLLKNINAAPEPEPKSAVTDLEEAAEYREQQSQLQRTGLKLLEESVRIDRSTAISELIKAYQKGGPDNVSIPELSCTVDVPALINLDPRGRGELLAQYYLATLPDKVKSSLNRLIYPALDAHPECPLELRTYDGVNCAATIRYDNNTQKKALKKNVKILRDNHMLANSDDPDHFAHEINFFKSVQLIRPFAFILLCGGCAISNGDYLTEPFSRPPNKPTTKDIFLFFKYRLLLLQPGDLLYGCAVHAADDDAAVRTISVEAVTRCAKECRVQLRGFNTLLLPGEQKTPPVMIQKGRTLVVYPFIPRHFSSVEQ